LDRKQNLNFDNLIINNKIRYGGHFEKGWTYKYLLRLIDWNHVLREANHAAHLLVKHGLSLDVDIKK